MASAMSGALATVRANMSAAPARPATQLPALPLDQAEALLARPPSMMLEVAISRASKLEEPAGTYVAQNGETLPIRRDPLRADAETAGEARQRLAAIDTILAQRPAPKAVVTWLYRLVQLVERPPTGHIMDTQVRALAQALDVPACCFAPGTVAKVARILTWWSGLAKLECALKTISAPLEDERRRLLAIVAAAAQPALPAPEAPSAASPSIRKRTAEDGGRCPNWT